MNTNYDNHIHTPCRIILAGPAGCGKSHLVNNLLQRREIFYPSAPKKVKYYFRDTLPAEKFDAVEYLNTKPLVSDMEPDSLVIIDDWMDTLRDGDDLLSLFTVYSRH